MGEAGGGRRRRGGERKERKLLSGYKINGKTNIFTYKYGIFTI